MRKNLYKICAIFDTETCNLVDLKQAFVVCYIFNDLRDVTIDDYEFEQSDDIRIYRTQDKAIEYLEDLMYWGLHNRTIPVVCAYNLMFDMQSILYALADKYEFNCLAQSSTHVYTLDVLKEGTLLLRFWDTFFLDMRGLSAMGESCGIRKLIGTWNYDLIRTPYTPLTTEEQQYASRDVQVIPAYLKWLVSVNDFICSKDLGVKILTKTSIVRMYAKVKIGKLKKGKTSLSSDYYFYTQRDKPYNYYSYALRRACFRGGFTFTSANYALQVFRNVASLDVTSMHHTYINHLMPQNFRPCDKEIIKEYMQRISNMSFDDLLSRYQNPFDCAFHVCVSIKDVRIKKGSCFERYGIGTLSEAKFKRRAAIVNGRSEASDYAEQIVKENGYIDVALNARFAFSKLISCDECMCFMNELEWFIFTHVYDYRTFKVNFGEFTQSTTIPCDYVTLQSNKLYLAKSQVKKALKFCADDKPYDGDLPDMLPPSYIEELRNGTCDYETLNSWYVSGLKGMFNGIYGVQAQDVYKPEFTADSSGVYLDKTTVATIQNFDTMDPHGRVIYTYGMRIVGWSRVHLITSVYLLHRALGDRVTVLGGDTDSLKVRCDCDVTDDELLEALKPIHDACDKSKSVVINNLKEKYTDVQDMADVGHFEVEKAGDGTRHDIHMELWNKARIDIDDGRATVTCAGVSRSKSWYDIDDAISDLYQTVGIERLQTLFGFNLNIDYSLCHNLERSACKPDDRYTGCVTDYLGYTYYLDVPCAVCLYPSSKTIGDLTQANNMNSVKYLMARGIKVCDEYRYISVVNGKPVLEYL